MPSQTFIVRILRPEDLLELLFHFVDVGFTPPVGSMPVVANRIDPARRERIAENLGGELSQVFQGVYTTGGTGPGLRICADLVSHGYGLASLRAALERGDLGARLIGDRFVAWFHWPARRLTA